jgi:branched-subunit amino acid transport protein
MSAADLQVWLAIAGLVAVVFATRNVFVFLPAHWQPRGAADRALRHAPLAALVALTAPAVTAGVLAAGWDVAAVWHDARLPAALATVAASRAFRSPFPGLAAGLVVLLGIGEGGT